MENNDKRTKKGSVNMEIKTFKIPPSGDVLVLAKRCPIGSQAAKTMLESVAPDQFELIGLEDDLLEAILVKKYLFMRVEKEKLIKIIVEEARQIMGPECMVTVKCDVILTVKRSI